MKSTSSSEVFIVYFDAASGHRSAAVAVANSLNKEANIQAQIINIFELFDAHQPFGRLIRIGIQWFNYCLQRDIIFDLGGQLNLSLLLHDFVGKKGVEKIATFWKDKNPAMIVSVTPMYNPLIQKSVDLYHPNTPYLVIPVDMEERKKRYWFTPKRNFDYATVNLRLQEQAQAIGIPTEKIHPLQGMIADESSSQKPRLNKVELFEKWGFDSNKVTVFVSFGGQGAVQVWKIAEAAKKQKIAANFIFMCGKDSKVFEKVSNLQTEFPKKVFSYTKETPIQYLLLSDLSVGKPGSMTFAEAQLANIPLFALRSTGLKLVQRGNEKYIEETSLGQIFPTVKALVAAIPSNKKEIEDTYDIPENHGLKDLSFLIKNLLGLEKKPNRENLLKTTIH